MNQDQQIKEQKSGMNEPTQEELEIIRRGGKNMIFKDILKEIWGDIRLAVKRGYNSVTYTLETEYLNRYSYNTMWTNFNTRKGLLGPKNIINNVFLKLKSDEFPRYNVLYSEGESSCTIYF